MDNRFMYGSVQEICEAAQHMVSGAYTLIQPILAENKRLENQVKTSADQIIDLQSRLRHAQYEIEDLDNTIIALIERKR